MSSNDRSGGTKGSPAKEDGAAESSSDGEGSQRGKPRLGTEKPTPLRHATPGAQPPPPGLPENVIVGFEPQPPGSPPETGLPEKLKTILVGKPRDLADRSLLQHVSLIAFLAWVGLGADGLSSSCYGPAEAFEHLAGYESLAIFLAVATIGTVFVISSCYSHIIEEFPSGGGGYLVASKLLGRRTGVVAGCALLVDYVLTITTSIAAAGDALFGLLAPGSDWKLWAEVAAIVVLIILNLRGVKESVIVMMPIFLVFLLTHAVVIFGVLGLHLPDVGHEVTEVASDVRTGLNDPAIGLLFMVSMLLKAYSLGAGTYTGIEAVSNSMQVMREPRVATGKRAMLYMAISLSVTAGGLIVGYLLLDIKRIDERTMNHLLTERFVGEIGLGNGVFGPGFVLITILSEGALLLIAAQAGFIGGPRMLANMAHDSWVPHWFANLSERLATHNGILLMGVAALAALLYTGGDVSALLVMYSINVFLTFSLSMIGMCRHWYQLRSRSPLWRKRLALFGAGATLCGAILVVTVLYKFNEGGWRTLFVTGCFVGICLGTERYYRTVSSKLKRLDDTLGDLVTRGEPVEGEPDPAQPTAVILVGGYSGLGVHTLLGAVRFAPGHFRNLVFMSAAVVDSGNFKGAGAVADLRDHSQTALDQYVALGRRLGFPSTSYLAVGTDAVDELEQLCLTIARRFPKAIFFAGQLVFREDTWYQRLMHNQTAFSLQRRLQWEGVPMVILPTRVR